jgi:cytochrome c biogenesis protein
MQRSTSRDLFELLSSMRFAISLLTVLAIASIIGTVIDQNEVFNAYLNQFGPFWFPVFEALGLYSVYNAGWFLVILAFLVLSTTLCIVRQTAPMLREMRSFREHARELSLRQFAHQQRFTHPLAPALASERVLDYVARAGFRARSNRRSDGLLIAAKQGSAGRSGYFLAHAAIVLICVGGLLDGDLPLRLQVALGGKATTAGNQLIADIPESARLDARNWSFRGNVFVPEGRSNRYAVLRLGDGILLQELPFTVSLKRFHIEHYENGMPSRFASDLIISDHDTGESFEHTIEVNRPLEYRGITMYQSGFEDGGSQLALQVRSLIAGATDAEPALEGAVGDTLELAHPQYRYALELTDFQAFNVEDFGHADDDGGVSARARLARQLGSGAAGANRRDFRNLGPSFTYKLRDDAGQAREFHNYMLPIERDGGWFMLSGMRESPAEPFRYLRLPIDEAGGLDTWFAIHRLLFDRERHAALAWRLATRNLGTDSADQQARARFAETALHTATLFADKGFESIGRFIENTVPATDHERATDVFLTLLQGLAWEAWMLAREEAGEPELEFDATRAMFVHNTLSALSDSRFYGAPLVVLLTGFEHRQATVLQVTRSPGKPVVYLGSLLLVLGVFAMLYIRERRLFVLLKDDGDTLVALSSNRKTLDIDETFERHVQGLRAALGSPATAPGHQSPRGT